MRTAEEIINTTYEKWKKSGLPFTDQTGLAWQIDAINEARIEAIKECAEKVTQNYNLTIDRQSILSIIEQVK